MDETHPMNVVSDPSWKEDIQDRNLIRLGKSNIVFDFQL